MSQENTMGAQKLISLKLMQVIVRGHIEQIRSLDDTRYTRIVMPTPDAYSRPQVVEVHAKQRLEEKGDEITVVCNLDGYQHKPYQFKNKDIGEVETTMPVDRMLDVVEA